MNVKVIMNDKGEVQKTSIQLMIEARNDGLGRLALEGLTKQINIFKRFETESEICLHKTLLYGYTLCCQDCGLVSKKSGDDLLRLIDELAKNELVRVREDGTHGK